MQAGDKRGAPSSRSCPLAQSGGPCPLSFTPSLRPQITYQVAQRRPSYHSRTVHLLGMLPPRPPFRAPSRTRRKRGKRGQRDGKRRNEVAGAHKAGVRGVTWQRGSGYANAVCTSPHFAHTTPFACHVCVPRGVGVVRAWKREGGGREDGSERRVVYALLTLCLPVA